ncbi:neural Wiskott-Aldrich syndrome protein isoform X1 [Salmo trutta]|uniref:neural Wiskott-Aldrich syndrome protein isoform X1 n=1 Tax=Salmo trutta TaxID=8032 RepID=UPI001130B644|nr:neural Wiskott-Aldrich syndrome protein-like isoform X1 [Salmo trutta]
MACNGGCGCPVFSNLLTVRENALLFTLLGAECKAVVSAVAQVYVSFPGRPVWRHEGCGVVCLVEDRSQNSYFLRVYCVKRSKLLWEQELYVPFRYSAPHPYFHTFPANDCQAGLNFADEAEAERFCAAVERQIQQAPDRASGQMNHTDSVDSSSGCICEQEQSRSEISTPSPYVSEQESQVRVDPEQGLSTRELDPALRKLVRMERQNEKDMTDRHTSKVIFSLIYSLGGVVADSRDMNNRGPASKTLPNRSTGTSTSLALRKGPLPPLPSPLTRSVSSRDVSKSPLPPWVPQPPSMPAPPPPAGAHAERIRKTMSFRPVGSPSAVESDLVLSALREIFQKRQYLQHHKGGPTVSLSPSHLITVCDVSLLWGHLKSGLFCSSSCLSSPPQMTPQASQRWILTAGSGCRDNRLRGEIPPCFHKHVVSQACCFLKSSLLSFTLN